MKMPRADKRRAKSWEALLAAVQAAGRPVAASPGPKVWAYIEIEVQKAGYLPIPRLVAQLFDLLPMDEMVLDPSPAGAGVGLLPMRELLRSLRRGGVTWGRLCRELRSQPVGVVTPQGTLQVSPRIFPAQVGETLVWLIKDEAGSFQLSLFRWLGSESSPPPEEAAKPRSAKRGTGRQAGKVSMSPLPGGKGKP